MSTLIEEQYARIQSALTDEVLWLQIEKGWMVSLGYEFKDGHWIRMRASNGNLCRGFAFDSLTGKFIEGSSDHHNGAYKKLVGEVAKELGDTLLAESRVLNGRVMNLEGFDFPVVQLFTCPVEKEEELEPLMEIEKRLLECGYLSLSSLVIKRDFSNREVIKKRLRKIKQHRDSS